ncbi:DNA polymerase delta subunit 4 [Cladorrhinum sp. PSN332]|nr:DNA polymerase delta subunit 4 [Cladorrhinum sp. PSN332]
MPATRRSTRSKSAAAGKQAKISFKSRVTKAIKDGEKPKPYKSPARAREWKPVPSEEDDDQGGDDYSESESDVKVEKIEVEELSLHDIEPVPKSEEDDATAQAKKVTDAAVIRYWKGIEDSRMAKEVHKRHGEGLEVGEKVLRYFDVSSQFGPCIGIARLKRWHRANRLGLHPPIEVLAVLVKEEEKGQLGKKGWERAHMDELLSSTAVGSV